MGEFPTDGDLLQRIHRELGEFRGEQRATNGEVCRLLQSHGATLRDHQHAIDGTEERDGLKVRVSRLDDFRTRVKWVVGILASGVFGLMAVVVAFALDRLFSN